MRETELRTTYPGKIVIGIVICLFFIPQSWSNQALTKSAQRFSQAIKKGDANTLTRLAHPKIVKAKGGTSKYRAIIGKMFKETKKSGAQFSVFQFANPHDIRRYGRIKVGTVPYKFEVRVGKKRVAEKSYYYVFSNASQTKWYFLDCTNGNPALLRYLVKGFDGKIKKPGKC